MEKIYGIPKGIKDVKNTFCPGCSHSTVEKLLAEVLSEEGLIDRSIICLDVSCGINARFYFDMDFIQTLHGRAAAVATGVSRVNPDRCVLTYQGDGGALSIGLAETFYAANRGEKMTVIVLNNQIYGMTGGQCSPTTLLGQRTTTGVRDAEKTGYPVCMAEILSGLRAPGYVARGSVHSPKHIRQTKEFIRRAVRCQMDEGRYSYVEVVSMCPTNWGVAAKDAPAFVEEKMLPVYPIGEFKTL